MAKRHTPLLWRAKCIALGGAVLYLVAITAGSDSAAGAMEQLGRQCRPAVEFLRRQLFDGRDNSLPPELQLVFHSSPVLLSGQDALLRRQEETEDEEAQTPLPEQTAPISEEPATPGATLIPMDNGVPARTLIPTSPDGYVVWGSVYIQNGTDKTLDPALPEGGFAAELSEEGPQILIVHTHGSESYTMPEGQSYVETSESRTTDNTYNMVRVGEELAAFLQENGFSVLHDTTLHDYPNYSGSYNRSLATVEDYLETYPTISMVLDLHRDAVTDSSGQPYKVVSTVAGVPVAQMSFVIGTDGGGLEHPLWPENLKLAAALQAKLLEDYPTLMRPITLRNSRYNQHTTTGSLLVEVGAAGNSLEEALLSVRLLGQAIVEVMGAKKLPPIG